MNYAEASSQNVTRFDTVAVQGAPCGIEWLTEILACFVRFLQAKPAQRTRGAVVLFGFRSIE
ncbi:hypothetical protein P7K49_007584 [Saguinus oedipus]|uniref:Uncharacterized protein n=1 Tax=Saguinus oedipus TaxID=9490 RepID=A0ABQ9VXP6_SAGOE|nr:hypothetical protein P7K49_007584 [Saguinus oedipus]